MTGHEVNSLIFCNVIGNGNTGNKRNRQLAFGDDIYADEQGIEKDMLVMSTCDIGDQQKSKAGVNEVWNNTHIHLVQDLQKKGTFTRYGVRHLKLWTDLIVSGKSKGVGDEPPWEDFISEIGVQPKHRSVAGNKDDQDRNNMNTNQLLQTIVLQNQVKNESFQNTLLAMMNTSMTMFQVRDNSNCSKTNTYI